MNWSVYLSTVYGYLKTTTTYELVDLFEHTVHVVQSGGADEVVEVLCCHPAQEVSFTEFNHRCRLQEEVWVKTTSILSKFSA